MDPKRPPRPAPLPRRDPSVPPPPPIRRSLHNLDEVEPIASVKPVIKQQSDGVPEAEGERILRLMKGLDESVKGLRSEVASWKKDTEERLLEGEKRFESLDNAVRGALERDAQNATLQTQLAQMQTAFSNRLGDLEKVAASAGGNAGRRTSAIVSIIVAAAFQLYQLLKGPVPPALPPHKSESAGELIRPAER